MSCLFCKIAAHEVESNIVYEDDKVIAFLDIYPVNPGHILVAPKGHAEQLLELPDDDLQPVMLVVKKMMKAVMNLPDVEGVNIIQNNFATAGQAIPHVHFHVIPRKTDDGHKHWPGSAYAEGEAGEMAEQIKKALV